MDVRIYRVDGFLLAENWKPSVEIFFVVRGGETEKAHKAFCDAQKKKLLSDNDDSYVSWRFTGDFFEDLGGVDPYATVMAFRIRDAW